MKDKDYKSILSSLACECPLTTWELIDIFWLWDSVYDMIAYEIDRCSDEEAKEYIREIKEKSEC